MTKYVMLGKYSLEGVKAASADRTGKAVKLIEDAGGKVDAMYATLGGYDLCFVINFPSSEAAMKTSIELSKLTNIAFTTMPAVTVDDFDKLLSK